MKTLIVDASVAAQWFFPDEPYVAAAMGLLEKDYRLLAPDLLVHEIANVSWKRVQRQGMQAAQARELLRLVLELPALRVVSTTSTTLVSQALDIALETGRTHYDSLYVALAREQNAPLVTADRKLFNGLQGTPHQPWVRWIESFDQGSGP